MGGGAGVICGRSGKTGFEESKDFPIRLGAVVAGRYQLMEYLGSAAFSKAVQALDLHMGLMVCIKIIKNNKDFFDQVRHLNTDTDSVAAVALQG